MFTNGAFWVSEMRKGGLQTRMGVWEIKKIKIDPSLKEDIEIVPVDCVMYLQPSFSDDRLSNLEKRESLVTSCCMLSDEEIDSFMKGDTI